MGSQKTTFLKRSTGKTHRHVCFSCRLRFHGSARARPCSGCQRPMTDLGAHLRAPKRSDSKAWKILEALSGLGVRFGSHGGLGPLPSNSHELLEFRERRLRYLALCRQSAHARSSLFRI